MAKYVYLAGPWVEREKMPAIAKLFEDAGWTVTHKWWVHEAEDAEQETLDYRIWCAQSDIKGVLDAHVLVVLNTVKSEGKAFEQGVAFIADVPICIIGRASLNIFHNLRVIEKVDTPEEALKWAEENR